MLRVNVESVVRRGDRTYYVVQMKSDDGRHRWQVQKRHR
jgi:hypothetical protein